MGRRDFLLLVTAAVLGAALATGASALATTPRTVAAGDTFWPTSTNARVVVHAAKGPTDWYVRAGMAGRATVGGLTVGNVWGMEPYGSGYPSGEVTLIVKITAAGRSKVAMYRTEIGGKLPATRPIPAGTPLKVEYWLDDLGARRHGIVTVTNWKYDAQ